MPTWGVCMGVMGILSRDERNIPSGHMSYSLTHSTCMHTCNAEKKQMPGLVNVDLNLFSMNLCYTLYIKQVFLTNLLYNNKAIID